MYAILKTLKLERKKKGFSQATLAAQANLSLATLQNIESGRANPSLETLTSLCLELDLKLAIHPSSPPSGLTELIMLGCPLMTEDNLHFEVPSRTRLSLILRSLDPLKLNLTEREGVAVHAWLSAIRDHYHSIWKDISPAAKNWFSRFDATAIKQRRLALAKLGEFL